MPDKEDDCTDLLAPFDPTTTVYDWPGMTGILFLYPAPPASPDPETKVSVWVYLDDALPLRHR